jgi:endonuclease G
MARKSDLGLPPRELRIASVLRSPELRAELAERAANQELVRHRELAFSGEVIADHLGRRRSAEEDVEFFQSRRMSEAIILEQGRPVLFVREGMVDVATLNDVEAKLKPVRQKMKKPIAGVGRIELFDHDTYDWCGTGWRIDEDRIITNRHVAAVFAQRQGARFTFRFNQMGKEVRARIDFREEYRGATSEEFGIAEVLWVADDTDTAPDVAILKVRRDDGLPQPLTLAARDAAPGQDIAAVGYPARDSRNDAAIMSRLFQDIYDVKRFSPGLVVSVPDGAWYLTHDATTLGGNSGAAVLDLATGAVVGLHFGGSFRETNYAVKASTLRGLLARRSWVPVTRETLGVPTEAFKDAERTKKEMEGRTGYRSEFLGEAVELPTPGKSHSVLEVGFPDGALPYTHFSIVMSGTRRFPIFTAENLDGELKISLKRKDRWGYDPRIPKKAQVGHQEFYGPQPFDKGHMVRRENPGWGATREEAMLGEDDTFVYTNAIPQMPQLNQKTWLSLENYVLENARTEGFKVCVFTGPVFRDDDPSYSDVQVPTDFWKVVVAIDADTQGLLSSAYLLSQEGFMPLEGFRYGPFKTYQVPLSRVEELADVRFPAAVQSADVFSGKEISEMVETARYVEITSEDDIVLTRERRGTAASAGAKGGARRRP